MLQEEEEEEGGIEMAPVRVCTSIYVCLLLVFPHDLTRDILNGIFGRRNEDWESNFSSLGSDSRVHGGYLRGGMGSILGNEPLSDFGIEKKLLVQKACLSSAIQTQILIKAGRGRTHPVPTPT